MRASIRVTQDDASARRAARCRCWTRSALPMLDAQRAADRPGTARTDRRRAARCRCWTHCGAFCGAIAVDACVDPDRARSHVSTTRSAARAVVQTLDALISVAHLWLYFLVHRWLVFRANTTTPPRRPGGGVTARSAKLRDTDRSKGDTRSVAEMRDDVKAPGANPDRLLSQSRRSRLHGAC